MLGMVRRPMARLPFRIAVGVASMLACLPLPAQISNSQQASAAVGKYCATCHSAQLHTAGLVLDPAGAAHAPTDAGRWEKVIHKLRGKSMPPVGAPRPDQATLDSLAGFFEKELDRAAATKPNGGKVP